MLRFLRYQNAGFPIVPAGRVRKYSPFCMRHVRRITPEGREPSLPSPDARAGGLELLLKRPIALASSLWLEVLTCPDAAEVCPCVVPWYTIPA